MPNRNEQSKSQYLETLHQNAPQQESKTEQLERIQQEQQSQQENQEVLRNIPQSSQKDPRQLGKSKQPPKDSYDKQYDKMKKLTGSKAFMGASMAGVYASGLGLGGLGGATLQAGTRSMSASQQMAKGQARKKHQDELGGIGKVDQLGRSISGIGKMTYSANLLHALGSTATGIGKDSISPTRSVTGMASSALGMPAVAAMMAPSLIGGIGASMKMSKIRPQKSAPEKIERESSKSKGLDPFYKRIITSGEQVQPMEQLQYLLMSYIESHTSVIPAIHSMLEEKKDKEDKAGKQIQPDQVSQLSPGEQQPDSIFNKIEDTINQTFSKYDPIAQISNLVFGGKTPKQFVDEIERGKVKDYSKKEEDKLQLIGIDKSQHRLINTSAGSLMAGTYSYEERMLGLTAGHYDLARLMTQETITMRKHGFGVDHNKFAAPVEQKGFLSKVISGMDTVAQSIPVLAAGYNAVKGLIQLPEKVSNIFKGAFSGGMNMIFGEKFRRFQDKEEVDRELGFDRSIQEKVNDYLAEGLPTQLEKMRMLSANQLEATYNIFDAVKSQYELLYGYYTGKSTQFDYEKKLGEDVTQEKVWDIVEKRMLTGEAFEKAQQKREQQRQFAREQAFGKSLYGVLSTDITNLGETFEEKMNRSMKPINRMSDIFEKMIGRERERTEQTQRFMTTEGKEVGVDEQGNKIYLSDYDVERKQETRQFIKGDKNVKGFAKEAEHEKLDPSIGGPIGSGLGLLGGGALLAGLGPAGLAAMSLSPIASMGFGASREAKLGKKAYEEIIEDYGQGGYFGRDIQSTEGEIEKRKISQQDRQSPIEQFTNTSADTYSVLKRRLPNIASNIGSFVSQFDVFKTKLFEKIDETKESILGKFDDIKNLIKNKSDSVLGKMDKMLMLLKNINTSIIDLKSIDSSNQPPPSNIIKLSDYMQPNYPSSDDYFKRTAVFDGTKLHPSIPTLVGEGRGSKISNTAEIIVGNNVISTDQTQAWLRDKNINTIEEFKTQIGGQALAEGTPNNAVSILSKLEQDEEERKRKEEQEEQKKQTRLLDSLVSGFKEEWKKEDEKKKKEGGFFSDLFGKLAGLATGTLSLLGILGGVGAIGASIFSGGSIGGKAAMSFVGNLFARFVGVLEKVVAKSKLLPELISKGFAKTGAIAAKIAKPFKGIINSLIEKIPQKISKFISGLIPTASKQISEDVAKFGAKKGAKWIPKIGSQVLKYLGWAGKSLKFIAKKVPFLGAFIGGYLAFKRATKGDYLGAVGELASGIASIFPGVGTAASIGIDVLLALKDMGSDEQKEEGQKIDTKKELGKVKENIFARAKKWPIISTFWHFGTAFANLFTGNFGGFFKELGLAGLNTIIPGFDVVTKIMSETKEKKERVRSGEQGEDLQKLRESFMYKLKSTPFIGSFVGLGSALLNFLTLDFKQGFKDLAHAGLSFPGVGLLMSLFEEDEEVEKVKAEKKSFGDIIKGLLGKLKDKFASAISGIPVIGGWVANKLFGTDFKDELDESGSDVSKKSGVSGRQKPISDDMSKEISKRLHDEGIIDRNFFGTDDLEKDRVGELTKKELQGLISTGRFKDDDIQFLKDELAKQNTLSKTEQTRRKVVTGENVEARLTFSDPKREARYEKQRDTSKRLKDAGITDDDLNVFAYSGGGKLKPGLSIIGEGKSGPISRSAEFTYTTSDGQTNVIPQDVSQKLIKGLDITRDNLETDSFKSKPERDNRSTSRGVWKNLFEGFIDQIFSQFKGLKSVDYISRYGMPLTKEKQKIFNQYQEDFVKEGIPRDEAAKKAINKISKEYPDYSSQYNEFLEKKIKKKPQFSMSGNIPIDSSIDNLNEKIAERNAMKEFVSSKQMNVAATASDFFNSNKDIIKSWEKELSYNGRQFYEKYKTTDDKYNQRLIIDLLKKEFKNRKWLSDDPDLDSNEYSRILQNIDRNWELNNQQTPERINMISDDSIVNRIRMADDEFKFAIKNHYPLIMDKVDRYNKLYKEYLKSENINIPHESAINQLKSEDPKYFEEYHKTLIDHTDITDKDSIDYKKAEKEAINAFVKNQYLKELKSRLSVETSPDEEYNKIINLIMEDETSKFGTRNRVRSKKDKISHLDYLELGNRKFEDVKKEHPYVAINDEFVAPKKHASQFIKSMLSRIIERSKELKGGLDVTDLKEKFENLNKYVSSWKIFGEEDFGNVRNASRSESYDISRNMDNHMNEFRNRLKKDDSNKLATQNRVDDQSWRKPDELGTRNRVDDEVLKKHIISHEGISLRKYKDITGHPTIGIGHKIEPTEDIPDRISKDKALELFNDDFKEHKKEAKDLSIFSKLDEVRKSALIDMVYNMGKGTVSKFRDMLGALSRKDYDTAADEALDSKWADQVGDRATKVANLIKSGDPKWFTTEKPQVIAQRGAYYTGDDTGPIKAASKGGKLSPSTPTLVGEGKGSKISNTAEIIVGNNVISTDQTQAFLKNNKIDTVEEFKSRVKGDIAANGTQNNGFSISSKRDRVVSQEADIYKLQENRENREKQAIQEQRNAQAAQKQDTSSSKEPIYVDNRTTNQNINDGKNNEQSVEGEFTPIDSHFDKVVMNLFSKTDFLGKTIEKYVFETPNLYQYY